MKQVSDAEVGVVLKWLANVLETGVTGDVVEMGCYRGETSVELGAALVDSGKDLWVYDSFEGLPGGGELPAGELKASEAEVLRRFKKQGLPEPYVVKGWFSELLERDIPGEICFAFLDGDFYESIRDSLGLVGNRMSAGGVIVVHDFSNRKLPGVRRAVGEFVKARNLAVKMDEGLAILRF